MYLRSVSSASSEEEEENEKRRKKEEEEKKKEKRKKKKNLFWEFSLREGQRRARFREVFVTGVGREGRSVKREKREIAWKNLRKIPPPDRYFFSPTPLD